NGTGAHAEAEHDAPATATSGEKDIEGESEEKRHSHFLVMILMTSSGSRAEARLKANSSSTIFPSTPFDKLIQSSFIFRFIAVPLSVLRCVFKRRILDAAVTAAHSEEHSHRPSSSSSTSTIHLLPLLCLLDLIGDGMAWPVVGAVLVPLVQPVELVCVILAFLALADVTIAMVVFFSCKKSCPTFMPEPSHFGREVTIVLFLGTAVLLMEGIAFVIYGMLLRHKESGGHELPWSALILAFLALADATIAMVVFFSCKKSCPTFMPEPSHFGREVTIALLPWNRRSAGGQWCSLTSVIQTQREARTEQPAAHPRNQDEVSTCH
ncbi:hypothetical protein Q5P01_000718, partial [Channa striata]